MITYRRSKKSNTIMHLMNCKTPNRKIGSDTGSIWVVIGPTQGGPRVDPGMTLGRPWVDPGSTLGLKSCGTDVGNIRLIRSISARHVIHHAGTFQHLKYSPLTHVPQLAKPARYLIHPSISDERAQDDVAYSARRSLHIPPPYHRYSLSSSCALIPPRLGTR